MPNKPPIFPALALPRNPSLVREPSVDDVSSEVMGERFRIERRLGAGGMGEVYAAHDDVLGADVALKMMKPELAQSSVALERFRREISLARRVTDPHVCRVFDVGEIDGRVFLTMELLDGKPLLGPLSIDELDRIAPQLVHGLAALHAAGIVHRDFKTANVMIVGDRAVITDFGLARSIEQDSHLTIDGGFLGTPAYMAPEQVEGRVATFASDVYALGVVLFELATGQLPFTGDTGMAIATARLKQDPPKPSSLRAELPAKWDAIIACCLARDPSARPAIGDVLATRHSRRWILGAAGVTLAGAGIGALWWSLRDPVPPPAALVAVVGVEGPGNLDEDPLRLALTVDVHDRLATSAIPMLHLYQGGMWEWFGGTAAELARAPDPTADAFANADVTHVVRTRLVAADPITVEVSIGARGARPTTATLKRPETEATMLVEDIARTIAQHLGAREPRRAGDAAAYASGLYTRYGSALVQFWSESGEVSSLRALLESTPDFARAGARLANRIVADAEQMQGDEVLRKLDRADVLLDRALARDPDLALAQATRGAVSMSRWDWHAVDRFTKRGMELAPTHQRVNYHRGMFFMLTGRFEEQLAFARFDLNMNPNAQQPLVGIASILANARRYQEVVDHVHAVEQRVTKPPLKLGLFVELAHAYAELARYAEAIEVADRVMAMPRGDDEAHQIARLAKQYVMAGRRDKALAVKTAVYEQAPPIAQAGIDDALGDIDAALVKLEAIVDGHNLAACFLKIRRFSPQLRSHPRFQALMKRVGFA